MPGSGGIIMTNPILTAMGPVVRPSAGPDRGARPAVRRRDSGRSLGYLTGWRAREPTLVEARWRYVRWAGWEYVRRLLMR